MQPLAGWMPTRISWETGSPQVEWLLLGDQRFTHPFFEETVQQALLHPFHQAFRRTTPIDTLAAHPSLPVKGFIFHMSRCGSTLLCQSLAALERNIVLSEAPAVDSILRAHLRDPAITHARRAVWLRSLLSALGRKRHPAEEGVFVKLDCWNIAELPVIRETFPDVPWIFLYRDPVEVLVSQMRQRALWAVPGALPQSVLGLDSASMPHDEYCARMLGRICQIALDHFRQYTRGIPVNYNELPDFCFSEMLDHFHLDLREDELHQMRQATARNSKSPGQAFEPDQQAKQNAATDRIRELAHRWIEPFYAQLESA
jgi:hypothetical protein